MAVSKEQIEYLANLARLDVTEKEKEKYADQMSAILNYFEELKELDTENVEPMAQVFEMSNISRADKVRKPFSADKVLAEAPELEKRLIKVKAVFSRDNE